MGDKLLRIAEINERPQSFFYFKDDVSTVTTVTTCRTTVWNVFLTTESDHPFSAVSGFYKNIHLIDKHLFSLLYVKRSGIYVLFVHIG